jgi:hypothetical protein
MFRPLYDQKHRFWGISSTPSKPNKVLQKGLRERLLCDHCEKQIGIYEDYACRVFFGEAAQEPIRVETGLLFSKLQYKPLKLFFMSLLWRFAVTSLREYKGLELGPHREKLRELIVADDPADFLTFPCRITAITHDRRHIPDIIMQPARTRFEGQHVWILLITGFLFQFFVSNRLPPKQLRAGFLRENGIMTLNISEIRDIPSLHDWMNEIARAERARASRTRP